MIYDLETKNTSFLQIANQLHINGVKNNLFMLTLYNENLVGVNPYSNNLTIEQKAEIYTEAKMNFWYFIRELAMVPQEGNTEGIHFVMNKGNCAICYCNVNNCNSLAVLPRQQGKTVAEVFFSVWVQLFSGSFITESYLHKNQSGAIDNLKRFKLYVDLLPKWLSSFIRDSKKDKDNQEEKFFSKNSNRIKALSSAQNDTAADKLGRGSSTAMVYIDEFAFLERNDIIIKALIPAWTTSKNVAAKNGAPYGIRLTTTPNNLSLKQARFCKDYIDNAYKFNYAFYDIPTDEIHDFIHDNSGNDFVYIIYTWQELGLTQEWYNGQLRQMNNDRFTVARELDCVWPRSDNDGVFSPEQMDKLREHKKEIKFRIKVGKYEIGFYDKIDFTLNYIITCDCSGGLSQDRSVISIVDPRTFALVGLFYQARIDTDNFRKLIETLAKDYFFNAIINIENNSMGIALLDILMKDSELEPRLYCEVVERKAERTYDDGEIKKGKEKKLSYGTSTNTSSRPKMYDLLPSIVDDEPQVFVAEPFIDEVNNLVYNKRGKIEARQGCHDDIVMSYLIFRYSVLYGTTFQNKFHINKVPSETNAQHDSYSKSVSDVYQHAMMGDILGSQVNNSEFSNFTIQAMQMAETQKRNDDLLDKTIEEKKDSQISDLLSMWNNM